MNNLYKPLLLGSTPLKGNIFLAPMAGYTDVAYRHVALDWGASLAFTEMVSCEALWRSSEKTHVLMQQAPNEPHLALQLFGGTLEAVEKALPHALAYNPAVIDFNCGCPVPKVNKSGSGSALMKNPALMGKIMALLRQNSPSSVAVTVKFRSGWDKESMNFLKVADEVLSNGADMISMHPRTRSQAYGGSADWNCLTTLKKHFPSALVCGSGDLNSPEAVKAMLEQTGIDAVMIARGSIGNPFIFKQIKQFLTTGVYEEESPEVKLQTALIHLNLALQHFEEGQAVREMKKHLMGYAKGIPGASAFKQQCAAMQSKQEALDLFNQYLH